MNNNYFFSNKGVVQNIVSSESYDVMYICKHYGNDALDQIQKYIKEEYLNYSNLTSKQLYDYMINISLDILNEEQIRNMLINGVNDCFKRKAFNNLANQNLIDYKDLVNMIIVSISLIPFRNRINKKYVDLFLVDKDGYIMSCNEYEEFLTNKECSFVLKFDK